MELEKQVCTLEQAKRLKELGVKQESNFYHNNGAVWYLYDVTDWGMQTQFYEDCLNDARLPERDDIISAFTVAELGEMLPYENEFNKSFFYSGYHSQLGKWECQHVGWKENAHHGRQLLHKEYGESEASARAAMLIYLLENNLLSVSTKQEIEK